MSTAYSHILKYTGVLGSVQGLSVAVALVRTKLVAVLLGPEGMGLIALFNSVVKFLSDTANMGFHVSAVREVSAAFEHGDKAAAAEAAHTVRAWLAVGAAVGMAVCVALAYPINRLIFGWGNHTLHIAMLAPTVGAAVVCCGEMAILKGLHRLGDIARVSVEGVVATLALSVPLYWLWGEAGIVPALFLSAAATLALTMRHSVREVPLVWRLPERWTARGRGMARLGLAFSVAALLNNGADMLVRSYLSHHASVAAVGLFNAAYMMVVVYGGMVFSAMETDFFPRLSAVNARQTTMNTTVNRQIEVSVLLAAPLLAVFMLAMPLVVPLLYARSFMAMLPMAQVLVLAMYVRSVKLPIAYITLARGDSRGFIALDAAYDLYIMAFVWAGFRLRGLEGIGWAYVAGSVVELVVVYLYQRCRHGYEFSKRALRYAAIQLPLGLAVFAATQCLAGAAAWAAGGAVAAVSAAVSWRMLRKITR